METKNLKGNGRIRVARTEIEAPYGNGIVTSVLPLIGPGRYQDVMTQISQDGLLRPTTGQTLALVNLALQNPDEDHCRNILERLRNNDFWSSTEILWGSEDAIVYDNVDGKMPTDRASLIQRRKDGDKSVRVVQYGFQTGIQSVSDLVKNPYVIAQAPEVPEEVIAFIAQKVSKKRPSVCSFKPQSRDLQTYSALDLYWNGGRLSLNGSYIDCYNTGYAFEVVPDKK